ncbi:MULTISPECIES: cell division protein FtsA [unclassified Bacillus (in: firmicutes)]|uniref:cell division protein FtsA n=1 Tax=unclassified Bacillus (in: firmicutes) TaxID=185979 RepID=UPI0008EC27FB|nr:MULTISPECIES: cell division protein FtsA [unclassified Bacillus (in: firmicutes)]SFI61212.1 cell division protein FtsA [Bacillus sp. 71mf]SFS44027.1 cell division protein FtsA [Bacillus sp. 103mf]
MNSNEIYVSLDIGTSNVKVIIGEMVNDALNIIGVGNVKSNGLKKGSIVDIDETVQSIKKAIEQAERMVGIHIERVVVGVNANQVQLLPCHGVVAVSNEDREIGNEDVLRVLDAAQVVSIAPEREFIDVVPRQFIVDGLDEINDPRGMIGVRLEMEGTLITGSRTLLHNLLRCVEKAGLEIIDICLQPLAASAVALSIDEKNRGVALVDIGGGSTTLSIFQDGELQTTSILPIGGDHITKDIAIGLKTSTENADQIKLKYGHAFYDTASEEEIFTVSMMGSDQTEQYSQLELADIIEARVEEILMLVQDEVQKLGLKQLPAGYVLTGGVVSMSGILDLANDILHQNVRIATPDYIGVREPQYTIGVGLIKNAYQKAKLRGKSMQEKQENYELQHTHAPVPAAVQQPVKQKPRNNNDNNDNNDNNERMMSKVKRVFRYLWD